MNVNVCLSVHNVEQYPIILTLIHNKFTQKFKKIVYELHVLKLLFTDRLKQIIYSNIMKLIMKLTRRFHNQR